MSHRTYFEVVPGTNGVNKIRFVCPVFDHTHDQPPVPEPEYVPERLALLDEINRDGGIERMQARMKHAGQRPKPANPQRLIGNYDLVYTMGLRRQQAKRMREYLGFSHRAIAAMLHVSRSGVFAAETMQGSNSAILQDMIAFLKDQIRQKALRWSKLHGRA